MNHAQLSALAQTTIAINLDDSVLYVTLNRPEKRNAMDAVMVAELIALFDSIEEDRSIRTVVLRGSEGNFCAGGDIAGMNASTQNDVPGERGTAWDYNRGYGRLISRVNRAPQVVVCLIEGAVLGGGFGLACASDVAIAHADSFFAMPETSLGIIPAQIAPFVVARIGITQARRLTLTGLRISGAEAYKLGMVHEVVENDAELTAKLEQTLRLIKRCAPQATAVTKQLILEVANINQLDNLLDGAADDFTNAIHSEEGQEGTVAFIEKRKPLWAE